MPTPPSTPIPWLYRAFFLYIEPVATAAGAFSAYFQPASYLDMTWPGVSSSLHPRDVIVLAQLANLYAAFALSEALVLRATSDRAVWKPFLFVLLLADFGHLWSVHPVGWHVYYQFWSWNAMYWGNLAFVYVGAALRTSFLLDINLPHLLSTTAKAKPA